MITITRRLAGQIRVVFRRALNITRGSGPELRFTTGPGGMRVRAKLGDAAVEYLSPDPQTQNAMWTTFELLGDVEARRDDPVQLEALGDGRVATGWRDGDVPQMTQYEAVTPSDADSFPKMPGKITENPARLLRALHEAMQTTDPESVRYAFSCSRLYGKTNTVAATDGRQILIEDGFDFPWDDKVLIPRSKFFGCKELPQDEPVAIGKAGDWVAVRVGPWSVYLKIETGKRYPDIEAHLPHSESAIATCRLSATDARFLLDNIRRLPSGDEHNWPVTLDLNGHVAIRAKAAGHSQPTELVLSDSTAGGEPMRINTNRQYLARAARLGFDKVHLYSPKAPVLCQDENRRYVWAVLNHEQIIAPADDLIRITSSETEQHASTTTRKPRRNKVTMPQSSSNGNGRAKTNGHARTASNDKADDQGIDVLIQQAETVKVSLRESLSKTGELISALKKHRKQSKTVQNALVSLRKLHTVDA